MWSCDHISFCEQRCEDIHKSLDINALLSARTALNTYLTDLMNDISPLRSMSEVRTPSWRFPHHPAGYHMAEKDPRNWINSTNHSKVMWIPIAQNIQHSFITSFVIMRSWFDWLIFSIYQCGGYPTKQCLSSCDPSSSWGPWVCDKYGRP